MSAARDDLDRAAREFQRRWGFDPRPLAGQILRDGDWEIEGGTEDERAFIREVLADAGGTP